MYYVEADDIISSRVKMMSSRDGVHWSEPQVVMQDLVRKYSILSPSIEILPDGTYMMWYVDTGNAGWNSQNNQVKYRTSADGIKWSAQSPVRILYNLDIKYGTSMYIMTHQAELTMQFIRLIRMAPIATTAICFSQ